MSIMDLTILHSNDIHGHFTGYADEDGKLHGSIAQVSGYVNKAKAENPNTIYAVAGDVFQGSLIDSDFLGLSSANILNMTNLDVMSLGNHELDYGISHMLFVDKYLNAQIVNTNFKVKNKEVHLFKPYHIIKVGDLNILFIGLLTKNIIDQTKAEGLVGSYVSIEDTNEEISKIYKTLERKNKHFDLTVLLSHIGYEADIELAKNLDPSWGIDIIVGGHSHTYLEQPTIVNDTLILQAGMENTHLGRLDMKIDTENSSIKSWEYKLIPVDEDHCPIDFMTRAMISTYVLDVDEKYSKLVTRLARRLDNNGRNCPTELGQLYADAFCKSLNGIDAFLLASSSMRCYYLDMTVSLQNLRESYPYDGKIFKIRVDGAQLRQMLTHALRDEVIDKIGETMYQTSKQIHIEYSQAEHKITSLTMNGEPVEDDKIYNIGLQEFYFLNSEIGFGLSNQELQKHGDVRTIASDAFEVLETYMSENKNIGGPIDDRLIIHRIDK